MFGHLILIKKIYPIYEESKRTHNDPEFRKMFPNNKLLPYNEYRIPYIERRTTERVRALFPPNLDGISAIFYSVCRARVESESTEKNGLFMRRF